MDLVIIINMSVIIHHLSHFTQKKIVTTSVCAFSVTLRNCTRSLWVVIESRAWSTSFNFLKIPVRQTRHLTMEGVSSPFQFGFPPFLVVIAIRDRGEEGFRKGSDTGCQPFNGSYVHLCLLV
jgi:hypothetical protein